MRYILSLVLCCAVLSSTGCYYGKYAGEPFGTRYTGPHACTLLTPAIAQSLLGKDAHRTQKMTPSNVVTQCQYSGKRGMVTVEAGNWKFLKPTASVTPVPGLGKDASVGPFALTVRKGSRALTVDIAMMSFDVNRTQLETKLAARLLPKL